MEWLPLAREDVRRFREDGFVRLEHFAPPHEVEEVAPIYDRLFQGKAGWDEGNYFDMGEPDETEAHVYVAPQMLQLSRYAPELKTLPLFKRCHALAKQILGPSAKLDLDHGIFKPARYSASTPWHQDEAFWDGRYDHDGLSVWIPLEPVDETSGCMQFIPRSHKGEVRRHRTIGGDPRVHGLEVPDFDPPFAQVCPLPLGGATVHHARTLHYSAPNTSPRNRRAYILVFTGRKRRRLFSRPQHREMTAQSVRFKRERAATVTGPA
jgi:ectoine hydroxylase-related dioxygenase (phytanoyl-CoA dioxygenase family)